MRLLSGTLLLWTLATAETIRFDNCLPGRLPAGWTVAMTHDGPPPRWEIVRDESAPRPPFALAQLSRDATAGRFPLAIWNAAAIRDGEVSVAFKTVDGAVDRAAGVIWRYQDANNYYIARANALENNVVLYKVENGTRLSIAPKGLPSRSYGVKHHIDRDRWGVLRVTFQGSSFVVFLDGERLFEAQDGSISKAGRTGLWTKADSVTYFDEFTVLGK